MTSFSNHSTLQLYLGFKFHCQRLFIKRANNKVLLSFNLANDLTWFSVRQRCLFHMIKSLCLWSKKMKNVCLICCQRVNWFWISSFPFCFWFCSFCWLCDSSWGQSCPVPLVVLCYMVVCNGKYGREWN